MKKAKFTTVSIVKGAFIAVLYFVISMAISPLAFGASQLRISEGLTVLLYYCPEATIGLTLGCFLTNLSSPFLFYDLVLGTFATFLSCILARKIKNKWLVGIPSVIINAFIVGWVLFKVLAIPHVTAFFGVFIGQAVSVYGVGFIIMLIIERTPKLKALISSEKVE